MLIFQSCVFDLPSHMDKAVADQWTDTKYDKLNKPSKLPDLAPIEKREIEERNRFRSRSYTGYQSRDFEGRNRYRNTSNKNYQPRNGYRSNWNEHGTNKHGFGGDRHPAKGYKTGFRDDQYDEDMEEHLFEGQFRKRNYSV